MITAPSTCFGMFDKKLSWSLLEHNSLIGTEMEEKRNKINIQYQYAIENLYIDARVKAFKIVTTR
jgi:hypothetical protein